MASSTVTGMLFEADSSSARSPSAPRHRPTPGSDDAAVYVMASPSQVPPRQGTSWFSDESESESKGMLRPPSNPQRSARLPTERAGGARPPNPSPVRPPRTATPSWLPPASTPGGACRLRDSGGRRWRGRERGPRPARALRASGAAKPRAIGNDRNQSAAGRTRTPQRSAGLPS